MGRWYRGENFDFFELVKILILDVRQMGMVSRDRLCPVSDAELPAIIVGFQSSEQRHETGHLPWTHKPRHASSF
jgi:hypothetical protein